MDRVRCGAGRDDRRDDRGGGSPFLRASRHRSDRHGPIGEICVGPARHRPAAAGRIDDHAADHAQHLPHQQLHRRAQDPRNHPGDGDGMEVFQAPDPRTLSQPRLFRRRRLWHRCRGAQVLRPFRHAAVAGRGRDPGRAGEGPVQLFAERGPAGRGRSRADRAGRDARCRQDQLSRTGRYRSGRRRAGARTQAQQRALFHGLGAGAARYADRRDDRADRRLYHARSRHAARRRRCDPAQHARRAAGGARLARSRRRGARDGGRQGLCLVHLQPRHAGAAPAGFGVQAVRLSGRARSRDGAVQPGGRRTRHDRRVEPAQQLAALFRADRPAHRLRLFDQHGRGQARPAGGLRYGGRHGAPVRDHHRDQHPSRDGARIVQRPPDRHDARLRLGRQRRRGGDALRHPARGAAGHAGSAVRTQDRRCPRAGGAAGGGADDRPAPDRGQHRLRPRRADRSAGGGQDRHDLVQQGRLVPGFFQRAHHRRLDGARRCARGRRAAGRSRAGAGLCRVHARRRRQPSRSRFPDRRHAARMAAGARRGSLFRRTGRR